MGEGCSIGSRPRLDCKHCNGQDLRMYGANHSISTIINQIKKDHATGGHPPLRIANLQRIDILCTKTIDNEHENGTTSYRHLSTTYYETKSYINLQHCQLVILL